MKASETQLQPVLEGSKQYVVPLFQRNYSWKQIDWETLWGDLTDLYESNIKREHFLGAIVTMPVDMQPHGVSKYLLIDGQQRLTTLFLLLAALRDEAKKRKIILAEQIEEQYLTNKWAQGFNRFKLLPTQGDRDDFESVMKASSKGQASILKAYRYFARKLKARDSHGNVFDLRRLLDLLVQQFVVVSIVLAKDENPYVIFESLNAKGQPLTQADLVRNFLFMRIPDKEEQHIAYHDLWRPIEQSLGSKLTEFMWRYLTKDGVFVRQSSIYEEIKGRISRLSTSKEVIDVLSDLHTYAGYYKKLISPETEPDKDMARRLDRLNRWEINTAYPFLLAIYADYDKGIISATQFCQVLDVIEAYVIRRFFCRVPTHGLNRMFIALYNSLDITDIVGSLCIHLAARKWPDDKTFLLGWQKYPIYSSGTSKCRHILETLESSLLQNNEPVDMTHEKITIEHIMPQTLSNDWELVLGEDSDQQHATWLHTIGNLTLTGKNEPMGNSPFAKKKPIFVESNFALNKAVADCDYWDVEAIEIRANSLFEIAVDTWQRPSVSEVVAKSNDPTGRKPKTLELFGEVHSIKTWRELLLTTVTQLVYLHGQEEFARKVANVVGIKRQYIAYTTLGMKSPTQIEGTGLFVETNLSSRSILSLAKKLMIVCGHSEDEFNAIWK